MTTQKQRKMFWEQFVGEAEKIFPAHSKLKPSTEGSLYISAPPPGVDYVYTILLDCSRVEIQIGNARDSRLNDKIFKKLLKQREEIQKEYRQKLIWEGRKGIKVRRLKHIVTNHGLLAIKEWTQIQRKMLNSMKRLITVFDGRLKNQ